MVMCAGSVCVGGVDHMFVCVCGDVLVNLG